MSVTLERCIFSLRALTHLKYSVFSAKVCDLEHTYRADWHPAILDEMVQSVTTLKDINKGVAKHTGVANTALSTDAQCL